MPICLFWEALGTSNEPFIVMHSLPFTGKLMKPFYSCKLIMTLIMNDLYVQYLWVFCFLLNEFLAGSFLTVTISVIYDQIFVEMTVKCSWKH